MRTTFPVIDTHTGGEITRVVWGEALGLVPAPPETHLRQLRSELDWVRASLTSEPRGVDYAVGAVVSPSTHSAAGWNVIFFNNVGYLGMCGHGLIGVVEALRFDERIQPGKHTFATPAGEVLAELNPQRQVIFTGVRSHCQRQDVRVVLDDQSEVVGDVAYGGNWFFLTQSVPLEKQRIETLTQRCLAIGRALQRESVVGAEGQRIDHIELCGPLPAGSSGVPQAAAGGQSFVLCPGGHYDRSPCGTGTSAKLACLAARDQLRPGQRWIQQSVTGSRFLAHYHPEQGGVRVTIEGRAHVTARSEQVYDLDDPLRLGLKVGTP